MTDTYCVIGDPVAHSLSPAMHNAAFKALGIDAIYERRLVSPADLARAIADMRDSGVRGINVTVPHKEAVMQHVDEVEPAARAIGAVNTLVRDGHRWIGCNTDAAGLASSLREAGVELQGARVVILGAGGAARAAIVGLGQAGAETITVAARSIDRAKGLARELTRASDTMVHGEDMGFGLTHALTTATLLVQATSATLASDPNAQAFADSIPIEALPGDATVIDLVYKPLTTTVMRRAEQCGLHTVDGLGMLLHQGALAFERWTGQKPPLPVMRAALIAAIG